MNRAPFTNFVIFQLLSGSDVSHILDTLKGFGYVSTEPEIVAIFNELRRNLPDDIKELVRSRNPLDPYNDVHARALNEYGVLEFYKYSQSLIKPVEEKPPYFKWCEDCLWLHSSSDIITLTNIFIFNGECLDSIADVLRFKYRRFIGAKALELHQRLFWDSDGIDAKQAVEYCHYFQDAVAIIRYLKSGQLEIEKMNIDHGEEDDGCAEPITFHSSNYIKWKLGYKKVPIPGTKDFLEDVKRDSYYRYYESMNMTQSVERETEEESGTNDKIGAFDSTLKRKRFRNVEEQKAKISKNYMEMFLKADASIPKSDENSNAEFFKKMNSVSLDFKPDEKLVVAENVEHLLSDIGGDIVR